MKKIIIAVSVVALTMSALVTSAVIKRNASTILNQNVEALLDEATIGVGAICMLQPIPQWCIYLYPYEEFQGVFVSDALVPTRDDDDNIRKP